ncbi:MAG: universal stress protein [Bacteroidetes bacterium]|nr:universal stress protein [Bacteroidota bacterium]
MKEIIVAIDFSKGSLYALELAIDIANKTSANIMMVWVDNETDTDTEFLALGSEARNDAKLHIEKIQKEYQPKLVNSTLSYKLRKGKVYSEIANQAKYNDADLIIAGTHGASGFEKMWMGSNAFRIVTYAPCPVITIRYGFNFKKKLEKIIVPIDSSADTRQKVPFACRMANYFGAEIHILGLYTTTLKAIRRKVDTYVEQVEKYLGDNKAKYVTSFLDADNTTTTTIEYAQQINADLIVIMTEQEKTAANFWLGPYAQQMVNNSPIPVLSIQPVEINNAAR